jgi:hypothetical protein
MPEEAEAHAERVYSPPATPHANEGTDGVRYGNRAARGERIPYAKTPPLKSASSRWKITLALSSVSSSARNIGSECM